MIFKTVLVLYYYLAEFFFCIFFPLKNFVPDFLLSRVLGLELISFYRIFDLQMQRESPALPCSIIYVLASSQSEASFLRFNSFSREPRWLDGFP